MARFRWIGDNLGSDDYILIDLAEIDTGYEFSIRLDELARYLPEIDERGVDHITGALRAMTAHAGVQVG